MKYILYLLEIDSFHLGGSRDLLLCAQNMACVDDMRQWLSWEGIVLKKRSTEIELAQTPYKLSTGTSQYRRSGSPEIRELKEQSRQTSPPFLKVRDTLLKSIHVQQTRVMHGSSGPGETHGSIYLASEHGDSFFLHYVATFWIHLFS